MTCEGLTHPTTSLRLSITGTGLGDLLFGLPAPLKALIVLTAFSPTIPLFSQIWVDEGMFETMAKMAPRIVFT